MTLADQTARPVTLTREDLYAQVWTTSILQLAKRYGLSDVGLAKVCRRRQIPRPAPGYWAKKAVNKAPPQTPLPALADPGLRTVIIDPQRTHEPRPPAPGDAPAPVDQPPAFQDPEVASVHERFARRLSEVKVPAALRSPLPIVATTLAALRRSVHERKRLTPGDKDEFFGPRPIDNQACLDVHVTQSNFGRAMRFMDALFKAFTACGFQVQIVREGYGRVTRLESLGERIRARLSELTAKVPHTPTREELERHEKYGTRVPKTHREPSGELCLTISGEQHNSEIQSWSDGHARRIEEMIPEIVRGVLKHVEDTRARRRTQAIEARRRAEEGMRRYQEEQRRREEQARVDAMLQEVERWERAKRIRGYLRALERTVLEHRGHIANGSEMDVWLNWAHAVADRVDPTTPYAQSPAPTTHPAPTEQ